MANQADIDRAKQGNAHWNAWAAQNPRAPVDFSFENLGGISFTGFQFPGEVEFYEAEFPSWADFTKVTFPNSVNFSGVTFSAGADFTGATFSDGAHFEGATFSSGAYFKGSNFSAGAYFNGVKFLSEAHFTESKFSSSAYFGGAKFASGAYFGKSEFLVAAIFGRADFFDAAHFLGGSFSREVLFNESHFRGRVDFANRKFGGPTCFRGSIFSQAPIFHGASIHQGTKFEDIDKTFIDFQSDEAEQCYRTLKLAMGKYQARTEEADFAALELKSRRHRLKSKAKEKKLGWKRFLSWAERCGYWLWDKLSDSGRSFFRPFAGYLISGFVFTAFYVLLCQIWFGDWWTSLRHGIRYSFLKQFPFAAAFRGGSDRIGELEAKLFGASLPPGWVDLLNATQSITALALIFLMGLGIRHKFRLR